MVRKTFRARPGAAALRAPLQPGRPRGVGDILPLSAGRPLVCFFVFPVSGVVGVAVSVSLTRLGCFSFRRRNVSFVCPLTGRRPRTARDEGPPTAAVRAPSGPARRHATRKRPPRRLFRVPGPGPEMNTRGYRQRPAPVAARPGAPADPRGPGPGPHNGPAHALWFFFFLGVLPGSIAFPVLASPPPPFFTPSTLLPPFLPRYPTRRGRPGVVQQRRRVSR